MNLSILATIEQSLNRFIEANPDIDPRFVLLDNQSYFELKLEMFEDSDEAITEEVTEVLGLKVFYNMLNYSYIDIA